MSLPILHITNPPPGFSGVLGLKHAERLIRQGRAVRIDENRIRLSDRHRRALANARNPRAESALGYDSVKRMLTQQEKRRLPIAQPPERPTKRRPVAVHARPGIVRVRYDHQLVDRSGASLA